MCQGGVLSLRKKLLDTFGAQVSSDHERYPADVKCLGFLYLYVGRYPRNNASRNTIARIDSSFRDIMRSLYQHERALTGAHERAFETLRAESEEIRALLEPAREKLAELFRLLGMKYTDHSGMNYMDRAGAMAAQRRRQNELAYPPRPQRKVRKKRTPKTTPAKTDREAGSE